MILKQQSILVVFEEKHYQRLSTEGFIPNRSLLCRTTHRNPNDRFGFNVFSFRPAKVRPHDIEIVYL